ncbi:retrovirus-related pol polyprotein from transposon TNT 1-94 [Tanacetum coccineum]|uniref:Retrovirus-related pol polyprotein from transposon TNT 1-94 n=1 Tax=Tanacetum coccineum TaxID=301880 RepID=A0ABQ4Y6C6_9ASTR
MDFLSSLILWRLLQLAYSLLDSGCSKHYNGQSISAVNGLNIIFGTVRFGNDQFDPIIGYGDLVQGNITINGVYYVEDLLQGNDLLTGNRGTDLYTISLQETTSSTPICLMAKASPTQAWLWHRRLSHLNFDYINLLSIEKMQLQPHAILKTDQSSSQLMRKRDGENLDKMKEKGDQFDEIKEMSKTSVANDTSGLVPQQQKASDYDNLDPVPELQNVSPSADTSSSKQVVGSSFRSFVR